MLYAVRSALGAFPLRRDGTDQFDPESVFRVNDPFIVWFSV
jgi:hypothetical protein